MPRILDRNDLNDRSQRLLKNLVARYIRDGQPVGSRTLSRDEEINLSPATIRNIMADLEDMGLIHAPHTSAGRVPTVQGYRLFIDSLLQIQPLSKQEVSALRNQLIADADERVMLEHASQILAEITRLAGVVFLPRQPEQALRHVEFLPLSDHRVLVILVLNEQEVQNRIIHTSRAYTETELQESANYLNAMFVGKNLDEIRAQLLREMRAAEAGSPCAREVVDLAFVPTNSESNRFYLTGQTNLMDAEELADIARLRGLFDAFQRKQDVLHLLDQALAADGVQIFIGEESGYQVFDHCSVVASPYQVDGKIIGVLGVIGPTRMPYDRVIPIVDMTAKLLGYALQHRG